MKKNHFLLLLAIYFGGFALMSVLASCNSYHTSKGIRITKRGDAIIAHSPTGKRYWKTSQVNFTDKGKGLCSITLK
jgi:hypothetical protein